MGTSGEWIEAAQGSVQTVERPDHKRPFLEEVLVWWKLLAKELGSCPLDASISSGAIRGQNIRLLPITPSWIAPGRTEPSGAVLPVLSDRSLKKLYRNHNPQT